MLTQTPDLVPARMLNEYAYCPRLFFLEWVDSLWASSADVAEGDRVHRRVDGGGGAAPLPDEGVLREARSVELASEPSPAASEISTAGIINRRSTARRAVIVPAGMAVHPLVPGTVRA